MKNWSRLILPLGLGILATVINAGAMRTRLTPVELVAVGRELKAGERITENDLVMVEVGYPSAHLKTHFWLWSERDALVQSMGTPVPLANGELIPRSAFRDYWRFVPVPEGSVEVSFRFHKDAMNPDDRRRMLPGKSVELTFPGGGEIKSARIAYLEPSKETGGNDSAGQYYQMGILLDRSMADGVVLLATKSVIRIVGLTDEDSAK